MTLPSPNVYVTTRLLIVIRKTNSDTFSHPPYLRDEWRAELTCQINQAIR
jgi:hypothetical protein